MADRQHISDDVAAVPAAGGVAAGWLVVALWALSAAERATLW
jgi:hypothetical protein